MESNQFISNLLVETKAYRDLSQPVILVNGVILGTYFVNAEKPCQDGGKFKKYGNDSLGMVKHEIKMTKEHPSFNEEIEIISEKVDELFDGIEKERRVVSGGQRRDWIFSGPVANKLDVPHVSLYKQKQGEEDKIEVIRNGSIDPSYSLKGKYAVHVVDLITKGSNIYRIENWQEMGWISMLRKKGATINDLVAVVTRCQGGEKMLADLPEPVNVHSFVAIDEDFVKKYSNNPERVLEYMKDSMEWTKNYLKDNGALAIVDAFDPNGSKQNRAEKFIKKHCQLLYDAGKLDEFEDAIQEKYGISVMETYDLNKILR